jgi:coenzyme F420 hydrogenase subunit beta
MSIIESTKEGYSVGSGAYSVVNDKIAITLNEYGEYQYNFKKEESLLSALPACCMSSENDNETTLAHQLYSDIKGVKHNPTIGFYKDLYIGYVAEGSYRENGSSGGMATWVLVELLKRDMIDGVIHVKPTDDGNTLFKYTISRTEQDIVSGAKSRYYPVEYSAMINKIKLSNERFAIVGIPSYITEIRLLQALIPSLKHTIKYTIGLICGHQKSSKYAECLAWQCGIKPGNLKYVDFRKKVLDRPANEYIAEFVGLVDGELVTITKNQNELFGSNWGHGFFKKKFSDYTDDVFSETADISLGDAWLPEYTKDSKGNNVVIVRNDEIASILKEAKSDQRLCLDMSCEDDIVSSQSGLVHHCKDEIGYRLHKRDVETKWRPKKRVEADRDLPLLRKLVQDTREDISTLSHKRYNEAVIIGDFDHFAKSMRLHVLKYKILYVLLSVKNKGILSIVSKAFQRIKCKLKKRSGE